MKHNHLKYSGCLLFCFLVLSICSHSQVWTRITGLPTTNELKTVKFINASVGWVAGGNGTILKTTDGGNNWTLQTSGTIKTAIVSSST